MRRRILGDDHYDTGVSYSNLGAALFNLSDHSASLKAFAAAEAIFRKTGSRVDVANVVEWTASIHQAQGKHDLALTELDEVLDIRKTELGANHPYTAEVHVNMANSRYAKGDVSGAIACLRDALRAYKAADTRDPQAIEYVRTSIVALCQQDPTCDRP